MLRCSLFAGSAARAPLMVPLQNPPLVSRKIRAFQTFGVLSSNGAPGLT